MNGDGGRSKIFCNASMPTQVVPLYGARRYSRSTTVTIYINLQYSPRTNNSKLKRFFSFVVCYFCCVSMFLVAILISDNHNSYNYRQSRILLVTSTFCCASSTLSIISHLLESVVLINSKNGKQPRQQL